MLAHLKSSEAPTKQRPRTTGGPHVFVPEAEYQGTRVIQMAGVFKLLSDMDLKVFYTHSVHYTKFCKFCVV